MARPAETAALSVAAGVNGPVWHTLSAEQVLQEEQVGEREGLSTAEAMARAQQFGPNKFATAKAESRWRAFLRQYADPMQVVLLVAGVGSLYPLKELGTGLLLLALTVFNAVLGLRQEGRQQRPSLPCRR